MYQIYISRMKQCWELTLRWESCPSASLNKIWIRNCLCGHARTYDGHFTPANTSAMRASSLCKWSFKCQWPPEEGEGSCLVGIWGACSRNYVFTQTKVILMIDILSQAISTLSRHSWARGISFPILACYNRLTIPSLGENVIIRRMVEQVNECYIPWIDSSFSSTSFVWIGHLHMIFLSKLEQLKGKGNVYGGCQ